MALYVAHVAADRSRGSGIDTSGMGARIVGTGDQGAVEGERDWYLDEIVVAVTEVKAVA